MKERSIFRLSGAIALLLAVFPATALAQDGEALFRNWMMSQRQAARDVSTVTMDERLSLSVDGGFGRQTLHMQAVRTAGPGADPAGRTVQFVELNGREIPADQGERFRRQQRGLWRPEMGRLFENFRFPVQEISRMRVSRPIVQEDNSGRTAWRVDLEPQLVPNPVERMTAWFETGDFRLSESLAVLRAPGAGTIRVRTSYRRVNDIDLPVRVFVEGSSRTQRRMRYFTTLFELDTEWSGHTLSFNDQ